MIRVVFYGCPGFVGHVSGKRACQFWAETGSDTFTFNPANLIPVNLAATPLQVIAEDWVNNVEVDDHIDDGGRTQVGPVFCDRSYAGAVYLSQRLWVKHRAKIQWPPFANTQDFQYQSAVYSAGPQEPLLRYHGFLATVASRNGNQLFVYITEAGKPRPSGPFWVQMDAPTEVDLPSNGMTSLTLASPTGTTGSLFLSFGKIGQLGLRLPKLPPAGSDDGITV